MTEAQFLCKLPALRTTASVNWLKAFKCGIRFALVHLKIKPTTRTKDDSKDKSAMFSLMSPDELAHLVLNTDGKFSFVV